MHKKKNNDAQCTQTGEEESICLSISSARLNYQCFPLVGMLHCRSMRDILVTFVIEFFLEMFQTRNSAQDLWNNHPYASSISSEMNVRIPYGCDLKNTKKPCLDRLFLLNRSHFCRKARTSKFILKGLDSLTKNRYNGHYTHIISPFSDKKNFSVLFMFIELLSYAGKQVFRRLACHQR